LRDVFASKPAPQAPANISEKTPFNAALTTPPVTNPDRADMGIPNHDTIRTDHKVVTEMVDFVIHLSSIRDTHPANPDELEHHTMASRTSFTLHFDEAERGKTVYVGLAWQNERGILGKYSEYKTAVVP